MHLVSFLRGVAFGGLLVYLFAPRSGAETREMLAQKGNDLKKLVSDDVMNLTGDESGHSTSRIISNTDTSSGNIYDPATLKEL